MTDLGNGDFKVRYSVVQCLTEFAETEVATVDKNELPFVATGEFNGTQTGETAEDTKADLSEKFTEPVETSQPEESDIEEVSQG